jgi:hypothetical protein
LAGGIKRDIQAINTSSMKPAITEFANFKEAEWLKMLFLISDTQAWLDELQREIVYSVPGDNKKKLFQKTYKISAMTLAHILERHYFKIPRHPLTSKFTIPVAEILHYLREAADLPSDPIPGNLNYYRTVTVKETVGFDRSGESTSIITVIIDGAGRIKTAFPGMLYESDVEKFPVVE